MTLKRTATIFFLTLSIFCYKGSGQDLSVLSYNIKYDNTNDTINNWNDRKSVMVTLLKKYGPQFIGMQEVLAHQLNYLTESLENYGYIGVGREDGEKKGEFSPILYKSDAYTLLESSTFWLSTTPDKVSVGWDAALERICTYGLFEHKTTKKKIWVFNTHFDHRGKKARGNSVKLLLKKINALNTEYLPVVLMGDFNLTPEKKPIKKLNRAFADAYMISKTLGKGPRGTFNGFDSSGSIEKRIDYIFISGLQVRHHTHIDERLPNGKHISDHLPVLSILENLP